MSSLVKALKEEAAAAPADKGGTGLENSCRDAITIFKAKGMRLVLVALLQGNPIRPLVSSACRCWRGR